MGLKDATRNRGNLIDHDAAHNLTRRLKDLIIQNRETQGNCPRVSLFVVPSIFNLHATLPLEPTNMKY